MTIIQLRPYVLQHVRACDALTVGRYTLDRVHVGQVVTLEHVADVLAEDRGACGCATMRLKRVETLLASAKKAGDTAAAARHLGEVRELRRIVRIAR